MGNEESSFGDEKDIEEDVSVVQSPIMEEEEEETTTVVIPEKLKFDPRYFSRKKYNEMYYKLVVEYIPFSLNNERLYQYNIRTPHSDEDRMIRRCTLTKNFYHRILCVIEKMAGQFKESEFIIRLVGIAKQTSKYVDLLLEKYKQNFRFSLTRKFSVPIRVKLEVAIGLAKSFEYTLSKGIGLVNFGASDIWFRYGFKPILDCSSPSKLVILGKGMKKKNKGITLHPKYAKYEAPELKRMVKKNRFIEDEMRTCLSYTFGILLVELFTFQFDPLRKRFMMGEKKFMFSNSMEDLIKIQEKCCSKNPSERYTDFNEIEKELTSLMKKLKGLYHYKTGGNDVLSKYFDVSEYLDLPEDVDEKERNMDCQILCERNFRIHGLEAFEIPKTFLLL